MNKKDRKEKRHGWQVAEENPEEDEREEQREKYRGKRRIYHGGGGQEPKMGMKAHREEE